MSRPLINPGALVWSGEHWINDLRSPSSDVTSAMVSLYHTRYSDGGEGTVAFIKIEGELGFRGACTDNRAVAQFVLDHRLPFDRTLPLIDAEIHRSGDIRYAPEWHIRTATDHIVATWSTLGPPLVVEGNAPIFRDDVDFFAVFVFASAASVVLNGQPVNGLPYPVRVWERTLGGARSSCMFALAETMTRVPTTPHCAMST